MLKLKDYTKYIIIATIAFFGFIFTNSHERYILLNENTLPGELTNVAKAAKEIDPKQIACLAKNIFYESNGEPFMGQVAVARVVMNRINHGFAKTPCGVVYQAYTIDKETESGQSQKVKLCQFSWVCEGKEEPHKNNPKYQQAKQIAYDVIVNDAYKDVLPKSVVFFHNTTVDPDWPYKKVKQIGNHIFYSKYKQEKTDKKI